MISSPREAKSQEEKYAGRIRITRLHTPSSSEWSRSNCRMRCATRLATRIDLTNEGCQPTDWLLHTLHPLLFPGQNKFPAWGKLSQKSNRFSTSRILPAVTSYHCRPCRLVLSIFDRSLTIQTSRLLHFLHSFIICPVTYACAYFVSVGARAYVPNPSQ
jgi:hypothetical protein